MRLLVIMIGVMFVAGNAQAGKDCEAKYQHGSYVNPNWHNLGEVTGGGKKQKCKERAAGRKDLAKAAVIASGVSAPPINQCGSALNVYFDTQVEGKRNSKDGYSTIAYGTVIPAVYKCDPGFTLQGTNCIKSVPAQIAAPARCSW